MTARVLTINERHLRTPDQLASLADFTYTEGEEVDSKVVIDNPNLSLYCFDDAGKRAIFARLPPGVDLTKVPFVYQTQGEQAERLVTVSYDAFLQLVAELPKVDTLILIYGPGRSGSTLLSHIFNELDTVMSLSEPDAVSRFAHLRDPDGSRDAELSELLDSAVRFLFKPNPYKKATTFSLKPRGEVIRAMDLYRAAFPGAKNLLAYREAVGWVASWSRFFRSRREPEYRPLGEWVDFFARLAGRGADDLRFYLGEGDGDVPLVKALALWWLFLMEDCLRQHERGVQALALRYDDLNAHREEVLRKVFAYCGLPVSGVEKALKAFDRDAQADTVLARADPSRGSTLRLTDQQLADVHDVLQRHPVINTPDFVLPGTLTV
jgi:hypothetical protein